MTRSMLLPAVSQSEMTEFNMGFDVISYPLGSETSGIVIDVANPEALAAIRSSLGDHPAVMYASACAVGETAEGTAARYRDLATGNGHEPEHVTVIGDDLGLVETAMVGGMGAVHITDERGLDGALSLLLEPEAHVDARFADHPLYSELSYGEVVSALCPRGEINVVGFVGRTGVGKSTTMQRLMDTVEARGGRGSLFQLDGFFKLSRAERKRWLTEPCISDDERAERENVTNWWDFDRALEALDRIRAGEHVEMDGLYDMERDGEKVGTLDIDPGEGGFSVFVEGTALLLPAMCRAMDSFVCLNAHDAVRTRSLLERNLRHGYSAEDSRQRKELTDAAERNNHLSYELRTRRATLGRLGVLDNGARSDHLRLMPSYIPAR